MEISPGDNIIFMKVGVHAQESLEDILRRKRREVEEVGFAMWGYGGNTCHPTRVREFAADVGPITLVMQKIDSHHFEDPVRAREYSPDGVNWLEVPQGINVLGSRFALCISSLDDVELSLDLSGTQVAVGAKRGQVGRKYISGRVDKACLTVVDAPVDAAAQTEISLVAPLVSPFAVLLRD